MALAALPALVAAAAALRMALLLMMLALLALVPKLFILLMVAVTMLRGTLTSSERAPGAAPLPSCCCGRGTGRGRGRAEAAASRLGPPCRLMRLSRAATCAVSAVRWLSSTVVCSLTLSLLAAALSLLR
jgi:hypothetical protein